MHVSVRFIINGQPWHIILDASVIAVNLAKQPHKSMRRLLHFLAQKEIGDYFGINI